MWFRNELSSLAEVSLFIYIYSEERFGFGQYQHFVSVSWERTANMCTGRPPTGWFDDTTSCIIQLWPPDDEHIVFETYRVYNKLIIKKKILCIKLVNYWDKYTEMRGQQNIKIFRDVTPWRQINNYWSFAVAFYLRYQGQAVHLDYLAVRTSNIDQNINISHLESLGICYTPIA